MVTVPMGISQFLSGKLLRRHPAAALPPRSALSEPPVTLCLETAKAALEQVNKRLDAELALKTSTETRALTLAGQCTTLLSAIAAAVLVEFYHNGVQRMPLLAAGITGAAFLFFAILFAYASAKPRSNNVLPGRLPDELWDDLTEPDMQGPEFIARLLMGQQNVMVQNERNQVARAKYLTWAIQMVISAVPAALAASLIIFQISGHPLKTVPDGRAHLSAPVSARAQSTGVKP